jgi:aryl-alcohol dehydrogenase-like predicted oxidoreductase
MSASSVSIAPISKPIFKTSIAAPNVGFGTTSLVKLNSSKEQLELLSETFELGLRYFDTAPYYGYGAAERVLGSFIRSRRDQVTITTKFGIQAMAGLGRVSGLIKLMKRWAKLSPFVHKLLSSRAHKAVQQNAFSVTEAKNSLERSLKALQTDYVDILLLHDPSPEHLTDELLDFLRNSVAQGKVKYFGISGPLAATPSSSNARAHYSSVLQFENSVLIQNLKRISASASDLTITFRALDQSFVRLRQYLTSSGQHKKWSQSLEADCSNSDVLAGLLFAWACRDNANGIVLFSTSSLAHLQKNMAAVSSEGFSSKQIAELERLVAASAI